MKYNIPEILAARPTVTDLGPVPNPEGFSAPCPPLHKVRGMDTNQIECDRPDLTSIPPQFHPAIHMAIVAHKKEFEGPSAFVAHINQGPLQPNRNFRVVAPHIDPMVKNYPVNDSAETNAFIVSDVLTTVFYDQAFKVPDYQFRFPHELNFALSEIFAEQAKPEARIVPPPHHLIQFSPYAVHEAQLSPVPVNRTFMLLRFF